jgi:hypothetical protein
MAGEETMGQSEVQICCHIIVCILQRLALLKAIDFSVVNSRHFTQKTKLEKEYCVKNYWFKKKNRLKTVKKGNIGQNLPQLHTTWKSAKQFPICMFWISPNLTKYSYWWLPLDQPNKIEKEVLAAQIFLFLNPLMWNQ